MINIQNSKIIYYGDKGNFVTVYFDFDPQAKTYYIVPTPRLVRAASGEPFFSLTKYIKNEGQVSGRCVFDVELAVDEEARKAVAKEYSGFSMGQLDWVAAEGYFSFSDDKGITEIPATPSMYGSNRVTFSVELSSGAMLEDFKNAFKAGDSVVSPFHIRYELVSLTKLTGVSVTVSYDASIAISYQQKIEYKKDTWGNKKAVVVEVRKNLQESGAGKVVIDWNIEKTDEMELRVHDWAWTTLENMVAQAVDTANKAATSNLPVDATSSFTQQFQENQVIEWIIESSNALERFDDATWNKVYHEVDLQELVVTFNTLGIFSKKDGQNPVDHITVSVEYGGQATRSFDLIPTDNTKNSFTYVAPGDFSSGSFNPSYTFRYTVHYADSSQPYESGPITSSDTLVTINPSLLGLRNVTFIGANIPFSGADITGPKTVDKLIIDFYFTRPEGVPNKVEQIVMTGNGTGNQVVFESYYMLPLENTYTYRYTFLHADNTVLVVNAAQAFGSENRDQLLVLYPYQKQEFTLKARKPAAGGPEIIEVDATVQYKDTQNNISDSYVYSWAPDYTAGKPIVQSEPWEFFAPVNPDAAFYEITGDIIYADDSAPLNNLRLPALRPSLLLDATQIPYTISIDTRQINWELVDNVLVNLFELKKGEELQTELLHYYMPALPPGMVESRLLRAAAEDTTYNVLSYSLLQPEAQHAPGYDYFYYYNIQRPRNSTNLSFFISAEYIQKDGTRLYMAETEIKNKTILSLPSNGTSDKPQILPAVIQVSAASPQTKTTA
jgi:hypothetical protein